MFLRLARFGDTGRLATSSAQDLFNVPTPFARARVLSPLPPPELTA
jgi:hypothetical protein